MNRKLKRDIMIQYVTVNHATTILSLLVSVYAIPETCPSISGQSAYLEVINYSVVKINYPCNIFLTNFLCVRYLSSVVRLVPKPIITLLETLSFSIHIILYFVVYVICVSFVLGGQDMVYFSSRQWLTLMESNLHPSL